VPVGELIGNGRIMSVKVILNPNADVGNGINYLDSIREAMRPLGDVDVVLTEGPNHARQLAEEAVNEGWDVIVAAGGDGTVNEVVNGIMAGGSDDVRLGIIPIGTGNDYAHVLGVGADVPTAIATIIRGDTRRVDLALLEDDLDRRRYFINNMGAGFDANVVIRNAAITKLRGFPKYMAAVLTALTRDFRPLHLHVRYDDEEVPDQRLFFLYFGIGTRGGGGFLLTPDALQDDDLIDTCTVPMLSRYKALSLITAAMEGTHVDTPYVTMRQNKEVVVHSEEGLPVQVDGEIYAYPEDGVHHLVITSLPEALLVIA
jgi:diacylglycerol kinase (ATP)